MRIAGEERWVVHRGRRPAARRARRPRCRSACRRRSSSRWPTRSATWSPATPAPTARSRRTTWRGASGSASPSCTPRCTGSSPPGGWSRASSGRPAAAPSGATPRCCGCCGGARSPRCARRSSRCHRSAWPGSCRPGSGVGSTLHAASTGCCASSSSWPGAAVPASALERLVLPARVRDYSPALLDELTAAGEVVWAGHGSLPGDDGWVSLHPADTAPTTLPVDRRRSSRPTCRTGSWPRSPATPRSFFRSLSDRVALSTATLLDDTVLEAALWDLVWAGRLTNDTLAPLRALTRGSGAHRARRTAPRGRYARLGRPRLPSRSGPPAMAGRWSLLPGPRAGPDPSAPPRSPRPCSTGTASSPAARSSPNAWPGASPPSTGCSPPSRTPGAADAATSSRASAPPSSPRPARSTGCGPPSRTGASRPRRSCWPRPTRPTRTAPRCPGPTARRQRSTAAPRRPGTARGARRARSSSWSTASSRSTSNAAAGHCCPSPTTPHTLQPAADALALAVRAGQLGRLQVERADGGSVLDSPLAVALAAAGFHATPRGLRLRG